MRKPTSSFKGTIQVPDIRTGWDVLDPPVREVQIDLTRDRTLHFEGGAQIETSEAFVTIWWNSPLWRDIFGE